jgi:hypothetical protein
MRSAPGLYRGLNTTLCRPRPGVKGSKLVAVPSPGEFDDIRRDPDPVSRGRRATELLTVYQQQAAELARLRRAAIEDAHHRLGLSYTQIAAAMGLTKGRVSQIRVSAPAPERAFFGIGPVSVGIPYRYQVTDRERPLIAAEDARAGAEAERLLGSYGFTVTTWQIEPHATALPAGDAVVICGPKSAPAAAALLARDPELAISEDAGRWQITSRSGQQYRSPADGEQPAPADIAYISRHRDGDRVIVHIAGIHAIGSLGAVRYLTASLADLFAQAGDTSFSLVTEAAYQGLTITSSRLLAGPFPW